MGNFLSRTVSRLSASLNKQNGSDDPAEAIAVSGFGDHLHAANRVSEPDAAPALASAAGDGAPRITGITPDNGFSRADFITNARQITILGTGTAGQRVIIFIDGVQLGVTSIGADGTWQFTPPIMAVGSHTLAVQGLNGTTVIDGAAPIALSILPATLTRPVLTSIGEDTGFDPQDFLTNSQRLTFSGTADAGTRVTLRLDNVAIATMTTGPDGTWQFTLPRDLAEGAHRLAIRAEDRAGNTAISANYDIAVDRTGPVGPGDLTIADRTPTLSGVTEAGARIALLDGQGQILGSVTADGTGHWTLDFDGAAEFVVGDYRLQITDAAGNVTESIVRIGEAGPETLPSPSAPALSATSDSGIADDGLTNDTTPTLTGSVPTGVTRILIAIDGGAFADAVVDAATRTWSFTPPVALDDGIHRFVARAMDDQGRVSTDSSALSVTIDTVPTAAPGFSINDQVGSLTGDVTDGVANDPAPVLRGIAPAGAVLIQISLNDGSFSNVTPAQDGSWSFTVPALPDGVARFSVRSVDAAGNVSGTTAHQVTIDTAAPAAPSAPVLAASSDSGTLGDGVTSDVTPTITGVLAADVTKILVSVDGGTEVDAILNRVDGTWSFTPGAALDTGAHRFTVRAVDAAGNISAASDVLTITIDTAVPATPDFTINDDIDGGTVGDVTDALSNDARPTLRGTAPAGAVTIQVSLDGGTSYSDVTPGNDGSWQFTPGSDLADGMVRFTVRAVGASGHVSDTMAHNVIIDTIAPTAQFTIDRPAGDTGSGNQTTDSTPRLTGTSEPFSTVSLSDSQGNVIRQVTASNTGAWTIDYTGTPLADGNYALSVTDRAGNSASGTLRISQAVIQFSAADIAGDTGSGQGVAWGDYDNDGRIDLYVTSSNGQANRLWHNDGNGNFSARAILQAPGWSRQAQWVDFDGDGDLDLYIAREGSGTGTPGPNQLWRNDGNGAFSNVSVAGDGGTSLGVSWGDVNGDGALDYYVANWANEENALFINNGNGFTRTVLGGGTDRGSSRAASFVDYDRDGDLDIFVLNDSGTGLNRLWRNDGTGNFTDASAASGIAASTAGTPLAGAWGDYDNDGDLDLYVARYQGNGTLYRNDNGVLTARAALGSIVSDATWAQWADYDQDGDLDLYVTNFNGQQNRLWRNDGNENFTDVSITGDTGNSSRASWVDYDYDGDLDLSVSNFGQNRIWQTGGTPPAGTYMAVRLTAADGGLDVNGAIVDLFDENGVRVATRTADGTQPVYFYNLTSQEYRIEITYNRAVVVHRDLNPSDSPSVTLAVAPEYQDANVILTASGYRDLFRAENDGTVLTINHFAAGVGGDKIEIGDLLVGYTGDGRLANLVAGGYLSVTDNGGNTEIRLDATGSSDGNQSVLIAVLNNVVPASLSDDNIIL